MQFQNNPFGSSGGFGMAGPGGFADSFGFDPSAMGSPLTQGKKKKKNGMFGNPMMAAISPLAFLMGNHPNAGLMAMSPLLGGLNLMGAFK